MLSQKQSKKDPIEPLGLDKENVGIPLDNLKTPAAGLRSRGNVLKPSTNKQASPSSPSHKKIRFSQQSPTSAAIKKLSTPALKNSLGLRDITNSVLKATPKFTDAISPNLLLNERKKRPLALGELSQSSMIPSKLHIVRNVEDIDFDSVRDSDLPDIEFASMEPEKLVKDDELETFDFSCLARSGLAESTTVAAAEEESMTKDIFVQEFDEAMSQLLIDPDFNFDSNDFKGTPNFN
jgi:hypothetical protein